jgi:hypothetical protein
MKEIVITTIRDNWPRISEILASIPREVPIRCQDLGLNNMTVIVQYGPGMQGPIIDKLIEDLRAQWPETTSKIMTPGLE